MPNRPQHEQDMAAPDHLALVLSGPHPVRLAGAQALLADLTPARLVALIDAIRLNAYRAGVQRGVRAARGARN